MSPTGSFRLSAALILTLAFNLGAEPFPKAPKPHDDNWCATSEATQERAALLDKWVRSREQQLAKAGKLVAAPESRIEDDIILLEATQSSLPFHHTLDLVGHSVVFDPDGTDSFQVSTTAIDYDSDVGESFHTFVDTGAGWHYRSLELTSFAFPLGSASYSRLYITAHHAIHFSAPPLGVADQFTLLDALSLEGAIVSPLMQTDQGTIFPLPAVFVKQTPDAVTVTWRSGPSEWGFGLDIQARLESSGRIVFSYESVDEFGWGTVLVTTGSEPWRSSRNSIFTQGTPVSGISGTVAQMLDLRSVTIERIGGSNVLEITLTVTAWLRPELLAEDHYLGYWVQLTDSSGGGDWVMLYLTDEDNQYRTPGWGWNARSPSAEYDGNTIKMRVLQDTLNLTPPFVNVSVATLNADNSPPVDSMSGTTSMGNWGREFGSDLSTLTSSTPVSGPVVEPFTVGELNPAAVWTQLKSEYGYRDDQIDGVAIFQDFYTSLILYAGAYSTVGNPGADGVSDYPGYGSQLPRSPALLHMNKVGYRWNADLPRSYHVLSHELGHRWLYFIDFDQGSGPDDALQPLGGHPAQYVHTPAAFPVYTNRDSSTMGGSYFFDHGNGTFSTPEEYGYFGYSWHDLYLMGLADPAEVEDWYYIENTNPALGGAYYPPPQVTVSGIRRDVTIDDVIRAMGPRYPTVATSQKRFKVVFVLMSQPGTEPSTETMQMLTEQRKWFERMFKVATGHRAEVTTTLVPVRRRGVRMP